jgi:hypothetical protein
LALLAPERETDRKGGKGKRKRGRGSVASGEKEKLRGGVAIEEKGVPFH